MPRQSIVDLQLKHKNVLLRADLNVPLENGIVSDTSRISRTIPTIKLIIQKGGRPILLSHLGRPSGKKDSALSLKKVLPTLNNQVEEEFLFCDSSAQPVIKKFIENAPPGSPILLENTRFWPGEETNDPELSIFLSTLADVYCNDAFSSSHRAHASTAGVAKKLPCCSGLLLEEELRALERSLTKPTHPVVAVVGGAKVSTKLTLLKNLLKKVDHIVIGGGMANTFLYAKGVEIGKSLCEKNLDDLASGILRDSQEQNCEVHLPLDIVCAKEFRENVDQQIYDLNHCPKDHMILDAGPKTVRNIEKIFENCNTLIWNGPLGAFEIKPFDVATRLSAVKAAQLTRDGKIVSVAGGGDTVAALNLSNVASDFSYVSTAGGAFLEWMEGKDLPGIKALE